MITHPVAAPQRQPPLHQSAVAMDVSAARLVGAEAAAQAAKRRGPMLSPKQSQR
jgi:hypothetical protein